MKRILFLAILLISWDVSFGQSTGRTKIPYDKLTGEYGYQFVVNAPECDSITLYKLVKDFLIEELDSRRFQSDKRNVELKLKIPFTFEYDVSTYGITTSHQYKCNYQMHIEFKDNRYRINISNITIARIIPNDKKQYKIEEFFQTNIRHSKKNGKKVNKKFGAIIDNNIRMLVNKIDKKVQDENW